jgi:Tfp pilus assembly protein PilF
MVGELIIGPNISESLGLRSLQGHAADALPDLEKAVSLQPKSKEAHQFLADAYLQLGQEEKAAASRS